jgi:tRNA 5-methylaminomethyl-2-thiouridine biosynthesis bifunctional protein
MTPMALLRACGLPHAWVAQERYVLLAAGARAVELGLAAWRAWREAPRRPRHLHLIVAGAPTVAPTGTHGSAARETALAVELARRWPVMTPNVHRVAFDDGRLQWLLLPGEPGTGMLELVARVDAFCIDRAIAASSLDDARRLARTCMRLASPDAMLAIEGPSTPTLDAFRAAGFRRLDDATRSAVSTRRGVAPEGQASTGDDGRTGAAVIVLRRDPSFPARATARAPTAASPDDRHALIVGAGLAGCATAQALAEHGWTSTLLERDAEVARGGSGQLAGLFHGIVHVRDGPHARVGRAAALEAHGAIAEAIACAGVRGSTTGLLQLLAADVDVVELQSRADMLRLPRAYVEALDPAAASRRAGVRLDRPAWFFAQGGWVDPVGLAGAHLLRAGAKVERRFGVAVDRLRPSPDGWELLDRRGAVLARGATVVLANAGDAPRLAGVAWPVDEVRGQTGMLRLGDAARVSVPRLAIGGGGYVVPLTDGTLFFGATAQRDDRDPSWRSTDHAENLCRLVSLWPDAPVDIAARDPAAGGGRVGWRAVTRDRLPLLGRVPSLAEIPTSEVDRLDRVPRVPGLFVHAGLGTRGISWSMLGAQVVAATIAGAPAPLEASLLDALDPARFLLRARRRARASIVSS